MDFVINDNELAALCGLPHIQQLAYLRGIRPYMDVKTGLVGIKRRISYQSISEQLYVEPHQGIKNQSFSRDQLRRALFGLARVGVIEVQSEGMQLILKCKLASMNYSVQNKAAINPPQKATINPHEKSLVNTGLSWSEYSKADIAESPKAATPLKDNNYIYLLAQFEKFWSLYPEKKSKQNAWQAFQQLNPDQLLINRIFQALEKQIHHRQMKQFNSEWSPPWKYPVNWLNQRCWEDEITVEQPKERKHAEHRKNNKNESSRDLFWIEEATEPTNNILLFKRS
jgi:hypothetical protein